MGCTHHRLVTTSRADKTSVIRRSKILRFQGCNNRALTKDRQGVSFFILKARAIFAEVTSKTQQFENSLNLLGIPQPVTTSCAVQIFGVKTQMQLLATHSRTTLRTVSEQACVTRTRKSHSAPKTANFDPCTERA